MIPYKQLNRHEPERGIYGDCFRTAIGCLLGLPPIAVPHFMENMSPDDDETDVLPVVREWLARRGLGLFTVAIVHPEGPEVFNLEAMLEWTKTVNPGMYMILGGQSKPGINHAVIVLDGEIVHDPSWEDRDPPLIGPSHPSNEWVLDVITPCIPRPQ